MRSVPRRLQRGFGSGGDARGGELLAAFAGEHADLGRDQHVEWHHEVLTVSGDSGAAETTKAAEPCVRSIAA